MVYKLFSNALYLFVFLTSWPTKWRSYVAKLFWISVSLPVTVISQDLHFPNLFYRTFHWNKTDDACFWKNKFAKKIRGYDILQYFYRFWNVEVNASSPGVRKVLWFSRNLRTGFCEEQISYQCTRETSNFICFRLRRQSIMKSP